MTDVRAKFYCYSVNKTVNGAQVTLQAVCRGEDNKSWAAATPAGKIEMTILNSLASEQFEPGEEYFIDFTLAPKGAEGMS